MLAENPDIVMIYATAGSEDEARRIACALVEEKLVACANLRPAHIALYVWQGETRQEAEWSFIAKTRAALVPAVTARITALHSYQVPCVVALPCVGGSSAFLDWVMAETSASA